MIVGCMVVAHAQQEDEQQKKLQVVRVTKYAAEGIIQSLQYIKDTRTEICYAYAPLLYSRGESKGGPILVTIPCEKVPEEMLILAEPE